MGGFANFFSDPIIRCAFNVLQIPGGSILMCSGCFTPTCIPLAAGLTVGTDSLSEESCRRFKLPAYLRLWRSRIKIRSLFSKTRMCSVCRFWLHKTGYIHENKPLTAFTPVPLYVSMNVDAHSRHWHGSTRMYPFLTLVKQCALPKETNKLQTLKIRLVGWREIK